MEQMSFIELLKDPIDSIVLYIVLTLNLVLTLVHFILELKGFQWRYLGAIAGLKIPDKLGARSFFVGPLVIIWGFGLAGIVRFFGWVPTAAAAACVAALIGTRLSDSIFTHILPNRRGYRPNPALGTIPFYLTEAAILAVLFSPGLRYHPIYAILGFSAGAALFFFVMPLLNVLHTIRHVEPWHAREEIPQWVKGRDAKEAVNA